MTTPTTAAKARKGTATRPTRKPARAAAVPAPEASLASTLLQSRRKDVRALAQAGLEPAACPNCGRILFHHPDMDVAVRE